jgi:hypothetical protein
VLRSDLPDGVYTPLSGAAPIAGTTFIDNISPGGFTWHYRVVAVDVSGNESEPAQTSAEREGGLGIVMGTLANVDTAGGTTYGFTATFSNKAQLTTEALTNAIIVTGPGGFAQAATVTAINGRTVSFAITPPGGSWNSSDSGPYAVSLEPNKIGDGVGNFMPAQQLGAFTATVPVTATDLGTFTRVGRKFGGKRIQRETLAPGGELYYTFTITEPARVRSMLGKMKDNLNLELQDSAGNVLASSANARRKPEKLMKPLPAGTYRIRVTHAGTVQSPVILRLIVGKPTKRDLAALGL